MSKSPLVLMPEASNKAILEPKSSVLPTVCSGSRCLFRLITSNSAKLTVSSTLPNIATIVKPVTDKAVHHLFAHVFKQSKSNNSRAAVFLV